jgi:hybrid polyketide synthase/nonribosomal peptide synthetase ACE1
MQQISEGKMQRELDFWTAEYPDFPPVLPLLPMSKVRSRQTLKAYHLNKVYMRLPVPLAEKVKATARSVKATSFHCYLAVFKTLLHRILEVEDLCIGIADGNRNDLDTLGTIGMFLNLLPLRFQSSTTQSFSDSLRDVRAKVYSALKNSRLPFDVLLESLDIPRSATHSPLFQTFVDYRQGVKEEVKFGNCTLDSFKLESGRTAYDITLDITEDANNEPLIILKTQSYLYSVQDTQIRMDCYINLLEKFTSTPGCLTQEPSLYRKAAIEKAVAVGRSKFDWFLYRSF